MTDTPTPPGAQPSASAPSAEAIGSTSRPRYLQRQAPPEDSYADGAAAILIGRSVLKLDLYRIVGFDRERNEEIRTVSHRVVLPVAAIPELVQLLQNLGHTIQTLNQREAKPQS